MSLQTYHIAPDFGLHISILTVMLVALGANSSAPMPVPTPAPTPGSVGLESCLRDAIQNVNVLGDSSYDVAKQCVNKRPDIIPSPLAVVRVNSVVEVQAAVRCTVVHGVQACARAGAHGFDNDAGCSGGVLIDVRDLQFFSVDVGTRLTSFGAGNCLGQLYYKLAQDPYHLLVPAGAVNGVGAAGLVLGCGRGLHTQQHGLACDSLIAVEYVDATGEVYIANATSNHEMLWIAKGGGGNFPGIVTKFTMQAYDMPTEVYTMHCSFPANEAKIVIKNWLAQGQAMVEPQRKLFTSLQMWNRPAVVDIVLYCFDCNVIEKQWLNSVMTSIKDTNPSQSCLAPLEVSRTWLEQILYESGHDHGMINVPDGRPKEEGLLDCSNGWGSKGPLNAAKNGGHMGYAWSVTDELLDDVLRFTHQDTPQQEYGVMVEWYLTGGPVVESVSRQATAYGPRNAKWVLHYKHQWAATEDNDEMEIMMEHHLSMSRAIDRHLPCSNFYNYLDNNMPCAATNDEWLQAHFSDVPRMKAIKAMADPNGLFRSRIAPDENSTKTTTSTLTPFSDAACSVHPRCDGLAGDCCPTAHGLQLGCCDTPSAAPSTTFENVIGITVTHTSTTTSVGIDETTTAITTTATEVPSLGAACSAHPRCVGLAGDCCPTLSGVWLGCCETVRRLQQQEGRFHFLARAPHHELK